jgi:ATP-dependent Zn protease
MPSDKLRGTAYHEAGHAVVQLYLGLPIVDVTIVPDRDEGSLGHMTHPPPLRLDIPATRLARRQAARDMMIGCYAGVAAQQLVDPSPAPFHGEDDSASASWLAREYGVRTDPVRLRREARRLVRQLSRYIDCLATALLKRPTLTEDEVKQLLRGMPTSYGSLE